jgi:hypothetical protein
MIHMIVNLIRVVMTHLMNMINNQGVTVSREVDLEEDQLVV